LSQFARRFRIYRQRPECGLQYQAKENLHGNQKTQAGEKASSHQALKFNAIANGSGGGSGKV
jgi:hypothetical protein